MSLPSISRKRRAAGIAVVCATLLAACAGPRPAAPDTAGVEAPAGWRDQPAGAASSDAPLVPSQWWRSFNDPVLNALVDHALEHNVDLAIAAARVQEARATFRLSQAQRWPELDAGGGVVRERTVSAFGTPEIQTAKKIELQVSYEFDLFGRLARASEAQRAALLATQASRETIRLAVAASVASGYLTLRALDARLIVIRQTVEARSESLRYARRRADSGYAPQLDLRQAEAEYHAALQLVPATELSIRRQEGALNVLLGDNPAPIARGLDLDALALVDAPAQLPSSVLRQRPDIAQAEQQLVATDRALDVARANFLPRISLSASGGFVDSTLLADPIRVFSLGGSVLVPLLDAGRLRAQAAAAAARRDQAAFAYRKAALGSFREVEDALATVQRSREQEQELVLQSQALQKALDLANGRYRSGYASYLEALDAQRGVLSADLSRLQSRSERLSATVSLFQSLGGGWDGETLGADSR
ncbi:efflux transporter outer membrane subunit [soil metagenome]